MSVLGLDSGCTVKYNPLPSGVPLGTPSGKGLYLTVYPSSRPNTDTVQEFWKQHCDLGCTSLWGKNIQNSHTKLKYFRPESNYKVGRRGLLS